MLKLSLVTSLLSLGLIFSVARAAPEDSDLEIQYGIGKVLVAEDANQILEHVARVLQRPDDMDTPTFAKFLMRLQVEVNQLARRNIRISPGPMFRFAAHVYGLAHPSNFPELSDGDSATSIDDVELRIWEQIAWSAAKMAGEALNLTASSNQYVELLLEPFLNRASTKGRVLAAELGNNAVQDRWGILYERKFHRPVADMILTAWEKLESRVWGEREVTFGEFLTAYIVPVPLGKMHNPRPKDVALLARKAAGVYQEIHDNIAGFGLVKVSETRHILLFLKKAGLIQPNYAGLFVDMCLNVPHVL